MQQGLANAIQDVRALGFKVGLHTAGHMPERLEPMLPLLDWCGLDIKGLPKDYPRITGTKTGAKSWQSLDLLLASDLAFEVRTTVHWGLLKPERFLKLIEALHEKGVSRFSVQRCRINNCFNRDLEDVSLPAQQEADLFAQADQLFEQFVVR